MKLLTYIFIFYAMKKSPRFIDNNSSKFWRWCVATLNKLRHNHGYNSWVMFKFGRLMVRDMCSHPTRSKFAFSRYHPFVWRR